MEADLAIIAPRSFRLLDLIIYLHLTVGWVFEITEKMLKVIMNNILLSDNYHTYFRKSILD